MNTNSLEFRELKNYGSRLIGKTAQSTLLTCIADNGHKIDHGPQLISGYEIIEQFMKPELMVIIGGESVLESTLYNISR
jgi:hypothetical protein